MSLLEVSDLRYQKGNRIFFDRLSFSLEKGKIYACIGPNGAGKTTLIRLLLGFLPPNGGTIRLQGSPIASMSEKQRFQTVSYIPQKKDIPGSFTVFETVLFGLSAGIRLGRLPKKEEEERVLAMLREFQLESLAERPMETLSGGEMQMVLIIRGLMKNPDLIFLDEPESGLDFQNQLRVLDTLRKLKQNGTTVFFNTHYPDHALRIANTTIAFLPDRVLVGPTSEIVREETIEKAFGVEVALQTVERYGESYTALLPIRQQDKS